MTATAQKAGNMGATHTDSFFNEPLVERDPQIFGAIENELERLQTGIELIPSENLVSRAVLEAQGSIMTNKYAEGYPGKRYYGGGEFVDVAENLALERVKKLYNCQYANVQPHSGSQANQAAFFAMMMPGDTFMGMDLAAGGHLTHGHSVNFSGRWFNAVQYTVKPDTHLIDFDNVRDLAKKHQPKVIIAGATAYPRIVDFKIFRQICDEVGAKLMVDMAHFSGLVAGGVYPNPCEYAHIVTSTTHKTIRGPRGGMTLSNDEETAKLVDKAVFPGLQGGPLMHVIAAKAVAFGEALQPEFKTYAKNVVENCQAMCATLQQRGLDLVSGGTDTHLALVDLRPYGVTGSKAQKSLERANITCNKNAIPYDTQKMTVTSGIRIGSPVGTTRGFGKAEFELVGNLIADVLAGLRDNPDDNSAAEQKAKTAVLDLCARFPIYREQY